MEIFMRDIGKMELDQAMEDYFSLMETFTKENGMKIILTEKENYKTLLTE